MTKEIALSSNACERDVTHIRQFVFDKLLKLAEPVIRSYKSDLYHDAMWIAKYVKGESFTFYWAVDAMGTCIGTDEHIVAGQRKYAFRITASVDERGRFSIEVTP